MGNNPTFPTLTATGKQPKTKKQTKTQKRMGWDNFGNTHPRKETKGIATWSDNTLLIILSTIW